MQEKSVYTKCSVYVLSCRVQDIRYPDFCYPVSGQGIHIDHSFTSILLDDRPTFSIHTHTHTECTSSQPTFTEKRTYTNNVRTRITQAHI